MRIASLCLLAIFGILLSCFVRGQQPGHTPNSPAAMQQEKASLVLWITAPKTRLRRGQGPNIEVTIENRGKQAATLIQPGDGSDYGWRTPITGWLVRRADQPATPRPKMPPLNHEMRCGNVNPLTKQEIFHLAPGERRSLKLWSGFDSLPFLQPGRYKVTFYYANDTTKQWNSIPDEPLPAWAALLVKGSTPCTLWSNDLLITVQ